MDPKWTQNGPKMDPEWTPRMDTQNGTRMEPEWNQNGPRMDPDGDTHILAHQEFDTHISEDHLTLGRQSVGPKISRFFFPSSFFLFCSLLGSLRGILLVFEAPGP